MQNPASKSYFGSQSQEEDLDCEVGKQRLQACKESDQDVALNDCQASLVKTQEKIKIEPTQEENQEHLHGLSNEGDQIHMENPLGVAIRGKGNILKDTSNPKEHHQGNHQKVFCCSKGLLKNQDEQHYETDQNKIFANEKKHKNKTEEKKIPFNKADRQHETEENRIPFNKADGRHETEENRIPFNKPGGQHETEENRIPFNKPGVQYETQENRTPFYKADRQHKTQENRTPFKEEPQNDIDVEAQHSPNSYNEESRENPCETDGMLANSNDRLSARGAAFNRNWKILVIAFGIVAGVGLVVAVAALVNSQSNQDKGKNDEIGPCVDCFKHLEKGAQFLDSLKNLNNTDMNCCHFSQRDILTFLKVIQDKGSKAVPFTFAHVDLLCPLEPSLSNATEDKGPEFPDGRIYLHFLKTKLVSGIDILEDTLTINVPGIYHVYSSFNFRPNSVLHCNEFKKQNWDFFIEVYSNGGSQNTGIRTTVTCSLETAGYDETSATSRLLQLKGGDSIRISISGYGLGYFKSYSSFFGLFRIGQ